MTLARPATQARLVRLAALAERVRVGTSVLLLPLGPAALVAKTGRRREEAASFLGGNYNQDFQPMIDSVAVVGSPGEAAQRVQAFVDAGARHLVFTPATRGDP